MVFCSQNLYRVNNRRTFAISYLLCEPIFLLRICLHHHFTNFEELYMLDQVHLLCAHRTFILYHVPHFLQSACRTLILHMTKDHQMLPCTSDCSVVPSTLIISMRIHASYVRSFSASWFLRRFDQVQLKTSDHLSPPTICSKVCCVAVIIT